MYKGGEYWQNLLLEIHDSFITFILIKRSMENEGQHFTVINVFVLHNNR